MEKNFTSDWFTPKLGPWCEHVVPRYRDRKSINWLDVGSYEGRSALWVLENLLGPDGKVFCIDIFDNYLGGLEWWGRRGYPERFDVNTAAERAAGSVVKLTGWTHEALRTLDCYAHFDGAYLDGGHLESEVERDLALLWPMLAQAAVLVCDDYGCEGQPGARRAINSFLDKHEGEHRVLYSGFQIIIQKLVDTCPWLPERMFTKDFFCSLDRETSWREHVVPRLRGLYAARWLEVGSYEGQSARWTLDNVLRGPMDIITCVDVFDRNVCGIDVWGGNRLYEDLFDRNVGCSKGVVKVKGNSAQILPRLRADGMTYHGIYLDGNHSAAAVDMDVRWAWDMLLPGGVLVIDDYVSETDPGTKIAVDEFLTEKGITATVLHKGFQIIIAKN
jgi:predicted O-methyltransferase YrrM